MPEPIEVRRLTPADLAAFQDGMPSWNTREYPTRLRFQERGLVVQLVAWAGSRPVGRGMLVRPGHPEWSISAWRATCPEIRDLAVAEAWRRRGIGSAIMDGLEAAAREGSADAIGLMVGLEETYGAARAVYERRGYRLAHGPFVASTGLDREDGSPFAVGGVCNYLVKSLGGGEADPAQPIRSRRSSGRGRTLRS